MRILFNFSFINSGGGQNVALNFIEDLEFNKDYFFLVIKNSKTHMLLKSKNFENILFTYNNRLLRLFFEFIYGKRILNKNKIEIIYTYFGYSFFPKKIPQVIGAADSNLFFPEINFWEGYHGIRLFFKKLIDKFRIYGLKNANGIIFENPILEKKCHELFNVKGKTITILPSINLDYNQADLNLKDLFKNNTPSKCGLFLCGWQINKGIFKIPEIAIRLKKKNIDFKFIITAPEDNSKIHLEFMRIINKYNLNNYIEIIGQVDKSNLKSLYSQVDVVFLLSKLESFSNNIIEAWSYERLLVISDEEWSKPICLNAAKYVDRENIHSIVEIIEDLSTEKNKFESTIKNGLTQLNRFPVINQKTKSELEFITKVLNYEKNS